MQMSSASPRPSLEEEVSMWVHLWATKASREQVLGRNMAAGDNTVVEPDISEPQSDPEEEDILKHIQGSQVQCGVSEW